MDIGKEEEIPITLPMPVDPRKVKREIPVPSQPVQEPAREPAKQDAEYVESFQEWIDAGIIEVQ
jgi:hypothetical protein